MIKKSVFMIFLIQRILHINLYLFIERISSVSDTRLNRCLQIDVWYGDREHLYYQNVEFSDSSCSLQRIRDRFTKHRKS